MLHPEIPPAYLAPAAADRHLSGLVHCFPGEHRERGSCTHIVRLLTHSYPFSYTHAWPYTERPSLSLSLSLSPNSVFFIFYVQTRTRSERILANTNCLPPPHRLLSHPRCAFLLPFLFYTTSNMASVNCPVCR